MKHFLVPENPILVRICSEPCQSDSVTSRMTWSASKKGGHDGGLCADLVPKEVAEAWLKYLREEIPTVAFRCSTQKQAANLKQGRAPRNGRGRTGREKGLASLAMQGSDSLGAETLLQLLKNYTRNSSIKTAITVGEHTNVVRGMQTLAALSYCAVAAS